MMVNGRFVHAEPGGFRRYAVEVVDQLSAAQVVTPPARISRGAPGKIWEQTVLARRARGGVLWSPATSGPVRHRDHVVTVHDLAPLLDPTTVSGRFAAVQRRLIPALTAAARTLVVDSGRIADELIRHLDVEPARIVIAPPGVSAPFRSVAQLDRREARRRLGLPLDGNLVGGLVSSIPRKNSAALLSVLEALTSSSDAATVVAGWDGPGRVFGSTQRQSARGVRDLGQLTDQGLAEFYRALNVFVWLPTYEGFGLPVVEAAAAGTAVVCTAVPAATEHLGGAVRIATAVEDAHAAVTTLLHEDRARQDLTARARDAVDGLRWSTTAAIIADVTEGVHV